MNEILRVERTRPDGSRTESVLTADHVLRTDGGMPRTLPGSDLATALASAPELVALDPVTRIEVTCADADVRATLLSALHDDDPTSEFDESAWPEDTDRLPATDESAVDEILRHRWLTIDGGTYHLLPVTRTRAVRIEDGEIASGTEVASASWSFDGDITSSTGHESLRVVGGDTMVRQNLGDDFPETEVEALDGDVVAAVVRWLDDNAYAPAYLLHAIPAPGLTADEQARLGDHWHQSVTIHIDNGPVIDQLCTQGERARLRSALADPTSAEGIETYQFLRAVLAGDKSIDDLLGSLM